MTNQKSPFLTQRTWRCIGGAAIACCGVMAWYGTDLIEQSKSPLFQCIYWGIFLCILILAFYMVILDLRYIKLQYLLGRKEILSETLLEESFRHKLRTAQEENGETAAQQGDGHKNR